MKYTALLYAGGDHQGILHGNEKIFKTMRKFGKTVLAQSIQLFLEDKECNQLVIVTNPHDLNKVVNSSIHEKIVHVNGGKNRFESILLGLLAVKEDYVLIHDGERPWITHENIEAILRELVHHDAVALAIPNTFSLQKVNQAGFITASLDNDDLYILQTPQGYQIEKILQAYLYCQKHNILCNDDATIFHKSFPNQVKIVAGSIYNNIILNPARDKND